MAVLVRVMERRHMARIFSVRQAKTGLILWTGAADDESHALDAMAREAGYADYAAMPADVRGGDANAVRLAFE